MFNGISMAGAVWKRARLEASELESKRAARTASEVRAQNEALQFDIQKLFTITEVLWGILKEKHGYTDEDLAQMMKEASPQGDGPGEAADGTDENLKCTGCGRTLIRRQARCLYCGAEAPVKPFAR